MNTIYLKTITSVFIVPTLKIDREDLFNNNLINGFIADINKEEYLDEDVVFLLFKPKDLNIFRKFLDKEYNNNPALIEDYDYEPNYIVLIYELNKDFKNDFDLIKQSKYSKVSQNFKDLFPKRVINFLKNPRIDQQSIQHLIFDKDIRLIEYWEKELKTDIIRESDIDIWPGFNLEKEILDIEQILKESTNEHKE